MGNKSVISGINRNNFILLGRLILSMLLDLYINNLIRSKFHFNN